MEGYIAQILWFAGDFAPRNWAYCSGQSMAIAQNSALFSLIGTTFGGNGTTTFNLPDFRDRCAIGAGNGAGLPAYTYGQKGGNNTATLTTAQLPPHTHPVTSAKETTTSIANSDEGPGNILAKANIYASGAAGNLANVTAQSTGNTGAGQAFSIKQPYLGMNFVICLYGVFPSRN
jgi:microcystin-dependent protein